MAHNRTETIEIPQGSTHEDVKANINSWMNTEVGRKYKVKERGESFVTIERRWNPTWQYFLLCIGILPGICCILVSKSWIKFTVTLQDGSARIDLATNYKSQAETDYQGFIYAITSAGTRSTGDSF